MSPEAAEQSQVPGKRRDIQGLRALAVALVVAYHLFPHRITGGYIGVDVFFVISGFLITGHMVREVQHSGRLSLRRFWQRRIARLLPAALLVLGVVLIAVVAIVPGSQTPDYLRQLAASGLYVQNWALAADAVDYLAQDTPATALQHFWSLSVEEQFYLIWPLLFVVIVWVSGHKSLRNTGTAQAGGARVDRHETPSGSVQVSASGLTRLRLITGITLTVIILASLAHSVMTTTSNPGWAYFATTTRAWEFAAGGLLAVLLPASGFRSLRAEPIGRGRWSWVRSQRVVGILQWCALGAIVIAAVLFSAATPFPGIAAVIPISAVVLLLACGNQQTPWGPGRILRSRLPVWLGDISYAVYLWHWPLIVLLPLATGQDLTRTQKLAIIAVTLLLAHLSTRLVENPLRRKFQQRPMRHSYAMAGVSSVMLLGIWWGGSAWLEHRADEARRELTQAEQTRECFGPQALGDTDCGPPMGSGEYAVDPATVALQNSQPTYPGCQVSFDATGPQDAPCVLGNDADPDHRLAIVGDSHATQWLSAMDRIAGENNWEVTVHTKVSCPTSSSRRVLDTEVDASYAQNCDAWNDAVMAELLAERPDAVIFAAYSSAYQYQERPAPAQWLQHPPADPWHPNDLDETDLDAAVLGFASTYQVLAEQGVPVVVIKSIPRTIDERVPDCLLREGRDVIRCGLPRDDALPEDPLATAATILGNPLVRLVDFDDRFCDDSWCYPVVGDVVVYRDYSHLSDEYAMLLSGPLQEEIAELLASGQ